MSTIDPIIVAVAEDADRDAIDALRHRVYAQELGQYPVSPTARLADAHPGSVILAARRGREVLGYIAITPPGSQRLRIDHYVSRDNLPFRIDERTAEARQLTVHPDARASTVAVRLLFACAAWLEAHDVTQVVTIGHTGVVPMYERYGAVRVGVLVHAGHVDYEVLRTTMTSLRSAVAGLAHLRHLVEHEDARWSARCPHGGRALDAAGPRLDDVGALDAIVDADVLDAWFPPSPRALEALARHAIRLSRTSPPPSAEPLVRAIAGRWGVRPDQVALGAGSSDLVYRALLDWLGPRSRVLVLDPSYAEYAHVAENVIGASVTRLALDRRDGYALSTARLRTELAKSYDLVVIVNPNNPTGTLVDGDALRDVLSCAPPSTRVWVDEAYLHFAGERHSLLADAARSENLFVCRTFSKSLALSGLRAAFLVGPARELERLRRRTPPWIVGFPAQVAALRALEDDAHYARYYAETVALRRDLAERLRQELGLDVFEGDTASVLVHLDDSDPVAADVCRLTSRAGVFVRDVKDFGPSAGERVLRISIKDRGANDRTLAALALALGRVRRPSARRELRTGT